MLKFKGRMPLESIGRRPILQFSKGIGLVGARNVLLVNSQKNNGGGDHGLFFEPSYFEVTQTRIDIEATCKRFMDEGLPPSIPFLPDNLVHHEEGALVTGMDGEMQWLDPAMHPLGPVSTPHPMRVRQGVITDGGAERLFAAATKAGVPVIADPKLTGLHRTEGVDWTLFQSQGLELMRRRLGASTGAEAAEKLLAQYHWNHLVVLSGEAGVTIYSRDEETVHAPCGLVDIRQMIGLIDAAAVAIAFSLSRDLDVHSTALLANAACECILGAERTDSFVLSKDDLIHRVGEHVWNLQVSKR